MYKNTLEKLIWLSKNLNLGTFFKNLKYVYLFFQINVKFDKEEMGFVMLS